MSENKTENRWLYTFTISKEIEIEEPVEEEVNGEKVKVIKKVKKTKDTHFALKRPTRKLVEQADMFYGVKLSEGIRAGLLTKALLLKRYRNDGGALSEADAAYFDELTTEAAKLNNEHQRLLINEDKLSKEDKETKIKEVISKGNKIMRDLQDFESINQSLFAHTAESKAQALLANWWVLFLSYWDKDSIENKENFAEFFPGDTFDDKMTQWDQHDESNDTVKLEAMARFGLIIGLWNSGARTKEHFDEGVKQYGSQAVEAVKEVDKT